MSANLYVDCVPPELPKKTMVKPQKSLNVTSSICFIKRLQVKSLTKAMKKRIFKNNRRTEKEDQTEAEATGGGGGGKPIKNFSSGQKS